MHENALVGGIFHSLLRTTIPTTISGDKNYLCRLASTEYVLPEDGDRIQSPESCVSNEGQNHG
jgi:hypothetical protein